MKPGLWLTGHWVSVLAWSGRVGSWVSVSDPVLQFDAFYSKSTDSDNLLML